MLTQESIAQFYEDVDALGLRFPVAEIHKVTKISKGTISDVLNKKLTPSANFLKSFYEGFAKSLKNVPREKAELQTVSHKGTVFKGYGLGFEETVKGVDPQRAQKSASERATIDYSVSLDIIRILTTNNQVLVETNAKLADRVLSLSETSSASDPSEQRKKDKLHGVERKASSGDKPAIRVVKREKPKGILTGKDK